VQLNPPHFGGERGGGWLKSFYIPTDVFPFPPPLPLPPHLSLSQRLMDELNRLVYMYTYTCVFVLGRCTCRCMRRYARSKRTYRCRYICKYTCRYMHIYIYMCIYSSTCTNSIEVFIYINDGLLLEQVPID